MWFGLPGDAEMRARGRWACVALVFGLLGGTACSSGDGGSSAEDSVVEADVRSTVPLTAPPVSVVDGPPMEEVAQGDPVRGTKTGSPLDDLPDGVEVLTDFGQRPDWSPDGERIVMIDESPIGDVWEVDVETGDATNLTEHLEGLGFARASYLSDGDLLLCGPTSGPTPSTERPEAGRFTGVLSVLRAPFDGVPEPLGVSCWEGIATAADSMRIAWNRSDVDYTDSDLVDRVVNGISEVWTGEVRDVDGRATIVDPRRVLDRDRFGELAVFEVQDFRPPDEDQLVVTAYAYQGGEVLTLDLETGEVTNRSNSSAYEEAEGVTVDGTYAFVERDIDYGGIEPGALDIWLLDLEDGEWERITEFNAWAPYYASNPSSSPDGRTMAFQLSLDGDVEGRGEGILVAPMP